MGALSHSWQRFARSGYVSRGFRRSAEAAVTDHLAQGAGHAIAATSAARPVALEVDVDDGEGRSLSGRHLLLPGHYRIGSGLGCDLVIVGCVVDTLCLLEIEADGSVGITSGVFGARLAEQAFDFGQTRAFQGGETFAYGSVRLTLQREDAPPQHPDPQLSPDSASTRGLRGGAQGQKRPASLPGMTDIAGKAAGALAGAVAKGGDSEGTGSVRFAFALMCALGAVLSVILATIEAYSGQVQTAAAPPDLRDRPVSLTSPEAVAAELRRRLLAAGAVFPADILVLADAVQVDMPADPDQGKLVAALVERVAQSTSVPLVTRRKLDPELQALVAAVTYKPDRRVIGRDGQAYAEGDVLAEGWLVVSIDVDRVLLRRGREEVAIAMRGAS